MDWCLIINPDVEIQDAHYISKVIQESHNWKDAVVIGTNIVLPSGNRQNPMKEKTFTQEIFWPIQLVRRKKTSYVLTNAMTGYCEKLSGCCFFVKANFLKEIDFLDESVFLYCEEPILASQVKRKGYQELFISELTAFHQHYDKKDGKRSSRMKLMLDSRIYWIKTYSNYGWIKKILAISSKRLEKLFWQII